MNTLITLENLKCCGLENLKCCGLEDLVKTTSKDWESNTKDYPQKDKI